MGGLFGGGGGSTRVENPPAPIVRSINAPGFSSRTTGPTENLNVTVQRKSVIDDLLGKFRTSNENALSELQALRPLVSPGVSQFRTSQINAIEDARKSAIGNLQENLSRRRVAGSSFANDALIRAEKEFAKAKSEVEAQATLQEIGLTTELINQELLRDQSSIAAELDQFNFEASLASGVSSQVQSGANTAAQIAASTNALNAQLSAQASASQGQFLGTLMQIGIMAATGGFGGGFAGAGASSPISVGTTAATGISL